MSYYYRGNLAVELEKKSRTVTKTKRTIRIKPTIPTGEKLLYLLFISLTVIGLGMVGVRYSQISQFNYDIQSTKKENRLLAEKNAAVKLQIEQMSNRDRIQSEAERQGMVFNPDAVHVLGQSKSQGQVQASSLPPTQSKQP
ncbi:cell division protein FtsL [Brevibacillus choshinensis]|uniref:cell division protein FtsL n=1 Tax=Brevibacillus choshinensis TaxID=54911 RepID=UPI002E247F74|nr:cell division protein FtsL [Brevibacillus choshinensis]MED4784550.1 cell division protein FtsL [Brevibacillus choshinensis]